MTVEISVKIFGGIIGKSMRLFETGFRILIFALLISKSAVDLGYLIIQTEVSFTGPRTRNQEDRNRDNLGNLVEKLPNKRVYLHRTPLNHIKIH